MSLRSVANEERNQWSVEDMISATLVMSANDAAEALGNRLAEEGHFTDKMNEKSKELNLSEDTKFTSASGLQTNKGDSKSNTKDLVLLVRELLTK